MWFPERFPASTWEWSSWKRHRAGSTSLLRNTSNPLPGPNVITALTLFFQRGKKSFLQLAAGISPFWSHTFSETWKSCGLASKPAHKGCFLGTALPPLITKSFWRCQEYLWEQKTSLMICSPWVSPYISLFTWNIMPQIVCWMKTPFLLSVMSQYLHTMETSGENPDNLLFDVVNVNFGRILPRLPRFTTSYTTLHNRVR